jgi:hypothetical protein
MNDTLIGNKKTRRKRSNIGSSPIHSTLEK